MKKTTPYAVICPIHAQQFLTYDEYSAQMSAPNVLWKCPICKHSAQWDDDNYEKYIDNYTGE